MAEAIDDTPRRWRGPVTVFAVPVRTDTAVDLTARPFNGHREAWIAPTDYTACPIVADTAREADCALIRYESARDPVGGCNIALFDPAGFARREPSALATWHLDADAHGVRAIADFRGDRLRFPREAFAHDPRLEPCPVTHDPRRRHTGDDGRNDHRAERASTGGDFHFN